MTLTKQEKIAGLEKYMELSERADGTKFYYFTADAPNELRAIYMEKCEIRDIDYETFNVALNIVSGIMTDKPDATPNEVEDGIYERAGDSASVYTSDRLGYLNIWNESEVSDIHREGCAESIADACAVWYGQRVEELAMYVKDWIFSN
jgi:hypothetical protein